MQARNNTEEVIKIDEFTIVLRYAQKPKHNTLDSIRDVLFNQNIAPTKCPKFCNQGENMR